jgi:hypothetical protein
VKLLLDSSAVIGVILREPGWEILRDRTGRGETPCRFSMRSGWNSASGDPVYGVALEAGGRGVSALRQTLG